MKYVVYALFCIVYLLTPPFPPCSSAAAIILVSTNLYTLKTKLKKEGDRERKTM